MLNLVNADACVSHAEAALEVNAQTGCVQRAEVYMANEDCNADAALQARLICWFSGWFWSLNLQSSLGLTNLPPRMLPACASSRQSCCTVLQASLDAAAGRCFTAVLLPADVR